MTNRLFCSVGLRARGIRRLAALFLALAALLIPAAFAASTADGGVQETRRVAPRIAVFFSPCERVAGVDCTAAASDKKGDELDDSWCRQTPQRDCLAEARASGRETLAVFGAPWCTACRAYERDTLGDPAVKRRIRRYSPVFVDTDVNERERDRHGVKVVPTTVLLGRDGGERGRLTEYRTVGELLDFLDKLERR